MAENYENVRNGMLKKYRMLFLHLNFKSIFILFYGFMVTNYIQQLQYKILKKDQSFG